MAEPPLTPSPLAPSRVVVRASTDYLIRVAAEGVKRFGSLRRMVILTAIGVANVQPIANSSLLTWRYAGVEQIPPDHERQPVGIRDLAASLNIPIEVVREEVASLIEAQLCVRAPGGVVIPTEVVRSSVIDDFQEASFALFCRMIDDLKAINFDFEAVKNRTDTGSTIVLDADFEASVSDKLPRRVVTRVTSVFYLSTAVGGSIPFGGDWLAASVFATIMSINSEALSKDPKEAWLYARADTPPPDNLRQAASIGEMSRRLAMSEPEISKLIDGLIREGKVVAVDGGYLASMAYMQSEPSLAAGLNMVRAFYRMIYDLTHLGVRL